MNKAMRKSTLVLALVGAIGWAGSLLIEGEPGFTATAWAAEDGHSEGGHSGGGHSGRGGPGGGMPRGHSGRDSGHDTGHDSGEDTSHDHDDGDSSHSGGSKGGSKGQGAGSGKGRGQDAAHGGGRSVEGRIFGGGRPVWAQEGIPEVELGRLNVGRAPGHVLARAEQEALAEYTDAMAALYNLSAEQAAALLQASFRDITRFDSPLQNLALYKDIMTFGQTQLPGITPHSPLDLAAIFLGSASDKTLTVSEDTVTAINRILGLVELDAMDRATLATKAETVREAIFIGHGDVTH